MNADGLQPDGDTSENCAALIDDDRFYIHDLACENLLAPLCEATPLAPPPKEVTVWLVWFFHNFS